MSRSRLIRALVLCAVLTLAAQAAWAGPAQPGETPASAWALFMQLWSSFPSSWPDVGCILDPYGGCGAAQAPAPPPLTDVGCIIAPNGEVGCIAEPNGRNSADQAPAPPPVPDVGCILDPNGGCGS